MKILFTISTFLLLAAFSHTSLGQWQQTNGPRGGLSACYASDDDEIYTGTNYGGIFRSVNNGASWTACNNGLTQFTVSTLHIDNETVYAGVGTNGLYRSTDHGESWTTFPSFWSSYNLTCIATEGDHIYIGTSGSGFMVSHDAGNTWQTAMNGIVPYIYYAAQTFLIRGDKVFGLVNGRVYVSVDHAATWTLSDVGLAEYGAYSIVNNGPNIIATSSMGLYTSTNEGVTWVSLATDLPEMPYGMSITAAGNFIYVSDNYYEGLYFSNDNGYNWTQIDFTPGNTIQNFYAIADGKLLVQSGYTAYSVLPTENAALYLTSDNGSSWNDVTHEITTTYCMAMAVRDDQIFTSTFGTGIYSTTDEGDSWTNTGMYNAHLRTMHVAGNTILAGGDVGVQRSLDNGATWTNSSAGLTNSSTQGFAHIGDNIFTATADGVFISTDNGDSWQPRNSGITTPWIYCLHAIGTSLYAGTYTGVFVSTNYGNSWTGISAGLPDMTGVTAIADMGDILFASLPDGVYRSDDAGGSWNLVFPGYDVSALEVYGDLLFVSKRVDYYVLETGVFVSDDMGATWQDANEGLTNNMVFNMLVAGDYIYACTLGSGVFRRPLADFVPENIREESTAQISVYPNPAGDQFILRASASLFGNEVIISNATGQQVMHKGKLMTTTMQVDCASLASGIYFIKIGEEKMKLVID